jgi:hypothetical protein
MIVLVTYIDEKGLCRISHGVDTSTDKIVIMSNDLLDSFRPKVWNNIIGEWVVEYVEK